MAIVDGRQRKLLLLPFRQYRYLRYCCNWSPILLLAIVAIVAIVATIAIDQSGDSGDSADSADSGDKW